MQPDASAFKTFLARVSRRIALIASVEGAAAGLAVAFGVSAAVIVIVRPLHLVAIAFTLPLIGLIVGAIANVIRVTRRRSADRAVESRAPECRNIVITAAEVLSDATRAESYMATMVVADASKRIASLDIRTLFPVNRSAIALALVGFVCVGGGMAVFSHAADATQPGAFRQGSALPAIRHVDLSITPPSYTGMKTASEHDVTRVTALAGSQIVVTVHADANSVDIETLQGRVGLRRASNDEFIGTIVADADGFIAVEPRLSSGGRGTRRLIGLSVTPDHGPRVKVTAPGKDMFVVRAPNALDVTIDADDDLALQSVSLRYTKVSGSGEQFTFTNGEVPVSITRTDDRDWRAKAAFDLGALKLIEGDMVVYRGVATDKRPGSTPTESDAFIVEVTSPGMVAAAGFSLDDEKDKYALSQQMVILKTERLIAKAKTFDTDSLTYQSQTVGAEQRAVRAEFVFMMGGELAEEVIAAADQSMLNEEAEAAGEADLAAGRMANRGRIALVQAIRSMSRASAQLNTSDLTNALAEEKSALVYLQQAFSRTRYLLRALTERERLDMSRRMTGVLALAARDTRPAADPAVDPALAALRQSLATIAALAATTTDSSAFLAAQSSATAQTLLRVDASSPALQRIAGTLDSAANAFSRSNADRGRALLDRAATELTAAIRIALPNGAPRPPSADVSRLAGALADALRRSGVRQ